MALSTGAGTAALRIWRRFVDERGSKPFRRQDLAEQLHSLTRPRSMKAANELADRLILQARREGTLTKAGHVHWCCVPLTERPLKSGRMARELGEVVNLPVTTHCPQKFVLIDLETGDVWAGAESSWVRANQPEVGEAAAILCGAATAVKQQGA